MTQTECEAFLSLIKTAELPDLGPGPRNAVLGVPALEGKLGPFLHSSSLTLDGQRLLRGAALLWHDHHGPAHDIAQDDHTAEGSFLHAILHRREPDYSNAKYWFRKVRSHPSFNSIAAKAKLLCADDPGACAELVSGNQWDAMTFVDLCQEAARKLRSEALTVRLRQLQAAEFEGLVEYIFDTRCAI